MSFLTTNCVAPDETPYLAASHLGLYYCTGLYKQHFLRKSVNTFLPISFKKFWVLKRTVSLYPQHMFWLRNKKNIFFGMPSYLKVCYKLMSKTGARHKWLNQIHTALKQASVLAKYHPHFSVPTQQSDRSRDRHPAECSPSC